MADSKISALAAVTDYIATDEFVLARSGVSNKITAANLRALLRGIGDTQLVYRYTVTGTDKTSIDTGVDTPDAGSNDFTDGDVLEIMIVSRTDRAVALDLLAMTFNNDTSSIYSRIYTTMTNNAVAGANETTNASIRLNSPGSSAAASVFGQNRIVIPNYAGTVAFKVGDYSEGVPDTTAGNTRHLTATLGYRSTSAITRVKITPETGGQKLKVGTQLLIYKRKAS